MILAPLCLALLSSARASEPPELAASLSAAHGAWRQGRPEEAASQYRYVLSLEPDNLEATVDLALTLRDAGQIRESLALWLKATLLKPGDPLLDAEYGWARLSAGELAEARSAFESSLRSSTARLARSEALVGLALTALADGDDERATARLREAYLISPYWLAAESHLLAVAGKGTDREALTLERQALAYDSMQYESLSALAGLYDDAGDPALAFKSYQALLKLSPADPDWLKRAAKASRYLSVPPESLLAIRRLGWPLMESPQPRPGRTVSVGLFADDLGSLVQLDSFRFVSSVDFEADDARLGAAASGKTRTQWEVRWAPDRDLVELYDSQHALRHATRQTLTIAPLAAGGTILVKSARAADWRGVDPGDRELMGSITIRRGGKGLVLSNETTLEAMLPSVVSLSLPESGFVEAYKAAAVEARTEASEYAASRHSGAPYGLCDSRHCLLYRGIQSETPAAVSAVRATAGESLAAGGRPVQARAHVACGGRTEDFSMQSVSDSTSAIGGVESPWDLERLVRSEPLESLLDGGSTLVAPSAVRWLRVLDAKDVVRRGERAFGLDAPTALTPIGRTNGGRALGLRWSSRGGARDLASAEAEQVLSPRSLRSALYSMWPIRDGKTLRWLVLFGVGTGDGKGLCRAGALGLASQGRSYRDILAHYFPGADIQRAK